MNRIRANLRLDSEMLKKVPTYYIYRSQEEERGRPIVDGVYIQRETIGVDPPEKMTLLLEWT